jgi:phage repressor protein C with HTH and peptisase S24 domain
MYEKRQTPQRRWLLQLFEQSGKSREGLATAIGRAPSAISKLINFQRELKVTELPAVAHYFGITTGTLQELMVGEGDEFEGRVVPVDLDQRTDDLPVHTVAAEIGEQGFELRRAEHMMGRPPALALVRSAYAYYCPSDRMSPAIRLGDVVVVDPSRPAAPGDDVSLVSSDGKLRVLGTLVEATDEAWVVSEHNPSRKTPFARTDWPTAHRVHSVVRR